MIIAELRVHKIPALKSCRDFLLTFYLGSKRGGVWAGVPPARAGLRPGPRPSGRQTPPLSKTKKPGRLRGLKFINLCALRVMQTIKIKACLIYGKHWLGWKGSNLRMSESKSDALPLGYTPK